MGCPEAELYRPVPEAPKGRVHEWVKSGGAKPACAGKPYAGRESKNDEKLRCR